MTRRRWKMVVAIAAMGAIGAWVFVPNNKAERQAHRMRRELQAEGFRTEVSNFNWRLPRETLESAAALLAAGQAVRDMMPSRGMGLFQPAGSNAAIVLAKKDQLQTAGSTNYWVELQELIQRHREKLDAASMALETGPIRFEPAHGPNGELTAAYVTEVRSLAAALAGRSLLCLHTHQEAEWWASLWAATRLATGWDPEPLEMAHAGRFYCVTLAARQAWEAVQMHALQRQQIEKLRWEWARADFFKGLPATAEVSCASVLSACEQERQLPAGGRASMRQAIGDMFDSPSRGWSQMTAGWRESRYRKFGVYEDEVRAMDHFRKRERGFRKMTNRAIWEEVRSIPELTNQLGSTSSGNSKLGAFVSQGMRGGGFTQRTLAARAAEAETRRRLVCAGLALESFYLKRGRYPASLADLGKESASLIDFMDGKPFRYQAFGGTNFIVYSTGLDCVDDGGIVRIEANQFGGGGFGRGFFRGEEPDLIWPRAATEEEETFKAHTSNFRETPNFNTQTAR